MNLPCTLVRVIGLTLAMSGTALAHPSAGPLEERAQIAVPLADLRLETQEGRRVAHARLSRAAELVCGPEPSHLADLKRVAAFKACKREALNGAEQRLREAEGGQQEASR